MSSSRSAVAAGMQAWGERARSAARFRDERRRRWVALVPLAAAGWAIVALGGVYGWGFGPAFLALFAALAAWSVGWTRQRLEACWSWTYLPALGFGGWCLLQAGTPLSVAPAASRSGLLEIAAALAAYVLVGQGLRSGADEGWIEASFAVAAAALGVLALTEILSGSTTVYWHFQLTDANPAGTFFNRNNFAGCMEMLLPVAAVAAWRHRRRGWQQQWVWLAAPALGVAAMVAAASRGGIAALGAEALAGAALVALGSRMPLEAPWTGEGAGGAFTDQSGRALPPSEFRPQPDRGPRGACALAAPPPARATGGGAHTARTVVAAGCALTVALIALAGTARLRGRFTGTAASGPSAPQRQELALSSLAMWRARPVTGWGLGAWAQVYPRFARFSSPVSFQYAHDDYLQALAETGLIGAVCGLGFLGVWGRQVWRRLRRGQLTPLAGGAAVGCSGLLLHSAVDFNLHVPANLLLFAALAAIAAAPAPRGSRAAAPRPRPSNEVAA